MALLAFARAASSAGDGGLLFLFILRRLQRKTLRLSEQYVKGIAITGFYQTSNEPLSTNLNYTYSFSRSALKERCKRHISFFEPFQPHDIPAFYYCPKFISTI